MPFDRPTLTELRDQVASDINAALPGADARIRYSNLGIIGEVLAGLASGHYGYLDWVALNAVPFTATGEFLEGWAALKGVTRKPATNASGAAAFTGTNGAIVPAGTAITRSDGVAYVTTADATVADHSVAVAVQATAPGAAGNASQGTTMVLGVGIAGVTGTGSATTVITGGTDVEPDAELRSRMLAAYASPPQGGAKSDYVEWALAVPGVTRCWVTPSGMGPGTIVLLFMMDDAEAAHDGFPQGVDGCATGETRDTAAVGDQLALANAIFEKQPVTALVYAVAPTPNLIGLTIAGISGVSVAVSRAIRAAVTNALLSSAVPGGVTNISSIERAIASVAGTDGFVLTGVTVSAGTVAPGAAGNITSNAGALPVLDSINFV